MASPLMTISPRTLSIHKRTGLLCNLILAERPFAVSAPGKPLFVGVSTRSVAFSGVTKRDPLSSPKTPCSAMIWKDLAAPTLVATRIDCRPVWVDAMDGKACKPLNL